MQSTPFFENSYPRLTVHNPAQDVSPNLTIENLSVKYRAIDALHQISFSVQPGRLVGIFGPNGAGKSTLIKAMLGLIPAVSGEVIYQGRALVDQLDRVAYVPQRSQIDWTYPVTVWDVVMMGRTKKTGWFQRYSSISRRLATQALERVGMMEFRDRAISDLSGGQQQRVFLARALAQQADVFCFDEPFVGIDQKTQTIMFDVFKELTRQNKLVLVVNHDLGESIVNFDELILLNKSLIASGSRQKVLTQDNLQQAYGGKVVFFSDAA
ncbi:MAG: metal ABC transporter ATP-binding protein [Leptolyngbya sp. Prado105]|jgi:manganese/iron transport system ATP-binding protein|nr:metal ABC transporter ATP-binding protein [Leptolyngbya sp. Prado105]